MSLTLQMFAVGPAYRVPLGGEQLETVPLIDGLGTLAFLYRAWEHGQLPVAGREVSRRLDDLERQEAEAKRDATIQCLLEQAGDGRDDGRE